MYVFLVKFSSKHTILGDGRKYLLGLKNFGIRSKFTCPVGPIFHLIGTTIAQTGRWSDYLKTIKIFYLIVIENVIGVAAFVVLGKVKFILESKVSCHFPARRSENLSGDFNFLPLFWPLVLVNISEQNWCSKKFCKTFFNFSQIWFWNFWSNLKN